MTWLVTYRGSDGHSVQETFSAASRAELFRLLGTRGIHAMRIEEGKTPTGIAQKISPSLAKLVACGIGAIVVVIVAVVIVKSVLRNSEKPVEIKRDATIKTERVRQPKPIDTVNVEDTSTMPKAAGEKKNVRMYLGQEVVRTEVFTNAGVLVERLYTADGKRHRINHIPPSIFKHASDEYLGIILSTPPGMPMAPLPDLSHDGNIEKAFLESLKDEIVIKDDDSDETKEIKLKVIAARESMDALLRQGIGFAEILEQERQLHNENVSVRAQVVAEYAELLRKASAEDAELYRTKINEQLLKMGIEEIKPKGNSQRGEE